MIRKLFFTFIISIPLNVFGTCEIKAPENLIVISKNISPAFEFKDCSEKQKRRFINHTSDFSGLLEPRSVQLAYQVELSQKSQIKSLRDFLENKLIKNKNYHIRNAKVVGRSSSYLSYEEFDEVEVSCDKCDLLGKHNAKIVHTNKKGRSNTLWLSFEKVKKTRVLSSLSAQSVSHKALHIKNFEWKEIYTDKPEQFFTDISQLSFFKAVRNLNEGIYLKRNYLTPITLVKTGDIATVKLKNKGIELKGKGIAIRSGKIGDIISLKNIRTKKIIMGKVVGKNSIEAQL